MPSGFIVAERIKIEGREATNEELERDLVPNTTEFALDEATQAIAAEEQRRGHLGMSVIGGECSRDLWLRFRWSLPDEPAARNNRIFRLGHVIEDELATLIRRIPGVVLHTVHPKTGQQFRFAYHGGHFGGSMDGAGKGFAEAPKLWHVWEAKSVGGKETADGDGARFKDLKKCRQVREWSPEYWVQAQCYMSASTMTRTIWTAYSKATSEIYVEIIEQEPQILDAMLAKAERIITATAPPESGYPNRNYYKIARWREPMTQRVYWGDQVPPEVNCRNCRSSRPVIDQPGAVWRCDRHSADLDLAHQQNGCPDHQWIPALVPANVVTIHPRGTKYETYDGVEFWNVSKGDKGGAPNLFESQEIEQFSRAGLHSQTIGDPVLAGLRANFGATIDKVIPNASHIPERV